MHANFGLALKEQLPRLHNFPNTFDGASDLINEDSQFARLVR